jgi:hypothetical protein
MVAVISEPFSSIEPKPEQWLNKDFFKVEKLKSVSTTFPVATNSWKITRETESGEWKLADSKSGEQLDSSKASGPGNAFSSPSFNDVAVNVRPEDLGLDKATVVTLDTFDNFTYTLKVGQKTNDNYPLTLTLAAQFPKERTPGKDEKPEDKDKLDKEFKEKQTKLQDKLSQEKGFEKWTYLVSSWTVDPVLKQRHELLAEKKEEKKDEKKDTSQTEEKKDEKPGATDATASPLPPVPSPLEEPATNKPTATGTTNSPPAATDSKPAPK